MPKLHNASLYGLVFVPQPIAIDSTPSCVVALSKDSGLPVTCQNIAEDIEDTMFTKITRYDHHVVQSYLPDRPQVHHNLRERYHNNALIPENVDMNDRNFIVSNVHTKEFASTNGNFPAILCCFIMFCLSRCICLAVCSCKSRCACQLD